MAGPRIGALPREVAEKVAAGEVIQRPGDVVKELVENAIDAILVRPDGMDAPVGPPAITVEIRGGGLEFIRVADDGCGIDPADLGLALARHATSKLRTVDDLEAVRTLGFRGEALPSIAAIAALTVISRPPQEEAGAFAEVAYGETLERGRRGAPIGTQITVRRLFGNLPARLAFQRTPGSEAAHIAHLVAVYALGYPEIRFSFVVDGRNALTTDGTDRRGALVAVHGPDAAQAAIEVGAEDGGVSVCGLMSPPDLTRGSRGDVLLLVNRRPVQNRALMHAVIEGYRGFIPDGRFPFVVLDITVPPGEVDVNVHPSKSDVRFRRDRLVYGTLQRAIRQMLVATASPPAVSAPLRSPPEWLTSPAANRTDTPLFPSARVEAPMRAPHLGDPGPLLGSLARLTAEVRPADTATPSPGASVAGNRLPPMRILGQIQNAYIVCEGPDGVYFIDQHAAHERVLYEGLMRDHGETAAQLLLEPQVVEVAASLLGSIDEHRQALRDRGFDVEQFGTRHAIVRSVPRGVRPTGDLVPVIASVIDALESPSAPTDAFDRVIATIACHSAVRFGDPLAPELMRELIERLEGTDIRAFCPHGRPTVVRLPALQLDRDFGRR
ncbi:MAG: DNA mismatch repair endonuclease MutL [Chloroflexi bacterium]|nr:DNA mismatch repair endonuclease MutL [Chloroflexota bacterium]